MTKVSENNKLIAKNTLMLYIRMFFTMIISLYTSRVVLRTLGEVDFGLFNVVGGIIVMFTFLNSAMTVTTQRYLNYYLGKDDSSKLQDVFNTSRLIHVFLAILIFLLAETIGLYFLWNKMNIPEERFVASMWVYQCSIIVTCLTIINVPYRASIISHEKMSAFAYISILEVVFKLLIVYLLLLSDIDKLILYAILMAIVHLTIVLIYKIYSYKKFTETKYKVVRDFHLFKEMFSFAGWSIFGNLSVVLYTQGINILLNIFFGPAVNAARGIAVQAEAAVKHFYVNFQTALNPQITKYYATEDSKNMITLILRSCRFSFFLTFLVALPLFIEAPLVLQLWLGEGNVPNYTISFLRIVLIIATIESINGPLITAASATGRIKKYQAIVGGIQLLIVPIAYIVLKLGGDPNSVFIVYLIISLIALITRVLLLRNLVGLVFTTFLREVSLPVLLVSLLAPVAPILLHHFSASNYLTLVLNILLSVIAVSIISFFILFTPNERRVICTEITKRMIKK